MSAAVGEALDVTLGVEERLARLADILVPASRAFAPSSRSTGTAGEPAVRVTG